MLLGNFIGTTANGSNDKNYANAIDGVFISFASNNAIGVEWVLQPDKTFVLGKIEGNTISNNNNDGIAINGGTSSFSNQILGNFIGTDGNGMFALPNTRNGIFIDNTDTNFIGSASPQFLSNGLNTARNVISGNGQAGIEVDGGTTGGGRTGPRNQIIVGNFIGTTKNGDAQLANGVVGIFLNNSPRNLIGGEVNSSSGTNDLSRNIISGIDQSSLISDVSTVGIQIFGGQSDNNFVLGNFIGTDVTGTRDFGNTIGVFINNSPNNTVGDLNGPNVISGNDDANVLVFGVGAKDNLISYNIIGLNAADNAPLTGLMNPRPDQSNPLDQFDPRSSIGVEVSQAFHPTIDHNDVSGNRVGIEIIGNGSLIVPQDAASLANDFKVVFGEVGQIDITQFVGAFSVVTSNSSAPISTPIRTSCLRPFSTRTVRARVFWSPMSAFPSSVHT